MPVQNLIQLRRGSYTEWASTDPVLSSGEPGFDITNNILKVGDGTSTWSNLHSVVTSDIQVYVKNTTGGSLTKGQAVYINGAQGNNATIQLSIAANEAGSSKTLGLLKQNLAVNEFGYVVSEGILEGVDTNNATADGDAMWLSPSVSGGIVYGLANKPSAPDHMVFLGYVLRKQLNNGRVYVKVQNGFELDELHNVALNGTTNGQFLQYNSGSGLWLASSSGNFTTLQVNSTGVSISGHSHTSSNITDFNSSVSGLLPTIANSGDNRVLTSTGSVYGINAESSLTFDGSLLNVNGSGLFASGLNLSNQTASTIASFDSNKNIVSLATNTYPTLTELSYIKGVTSAVQTQIDTKATTATTITAGSGLAGGGSLASNRTIDIGQGDGISVSADSIAVDSTVVRTTGTQSITGAKTFTDATVFATGITASGNFTMSNQTASTIAGYDASKNVSSLSTATYPNLTELSYVKGATSALQTQIDGKAASSHMHISSNITDFNSSVSGLLPVKNIISGTGIYISSTDGTYTINSTSTGGGGGAAANVGNYADNRIITSDGTSTGLNAEGNFTFDGTKLVVNNSYETSPTGTIIGANGWIYQSGQTVLSQGSFSTNGDSQYSQFLLRGITTGLSWTPLKNNGATAILLASNRTYSFNTTIVGRSTNTANNAAYRLEGLLYNDGYGAAIIGDPIKNTLGETDPSWDVRVRISGGGSGLSDYLLTEVSGADSTTINWLAKVDLLEVGGYTGGYELNVLKFS